jgi:hypothetical protein
MKENKSAMIKRFEKQSQENTQVSENIKAL